MINFVLLLSLFIAFPVFSSDKSQKPNKVICKVLAETYERRHRPRVPVIEAVEVSVQDLPAVVDREIAFQSLHFSDREHFNAQKDFSLKMHFKLEAVKWNSTLDGEGWVIQMSQGNFQLFQAEKKISSQLLNARYERYDLSNFDAYFSDRSGEELYALNTETQKAVPVIKLLPSCSLIKP